MEGILHGLLAQAKNTNLKEAVNQAKETLKNEAEKKDTPLPYVREKLLNAFEIAFEHGNEKAQHHAVEGLQNLLRDKRFRSLQVEDPKDSLATQVLNAMNSISHWNHQLQCHCLTVIVELICSVEHKVTIGELQMALELCMRVFGSSREESARMSARAAISQSITSYWSNGYNQCNDSQIAVFMDATSLLEGYIIKLEQLTAENDQSLCKEQHHMSFSCGLRPDLVNVQVLFDATIALLAAQPLDILTHQPFSNLMWEKLCPLMIGLLGVPDKNVSSTSYSTQNTQNKENGSQPTMDPIGEGQMAKFALSPAVLANPEATRALYLIVEQILRLLCGVSSLNSVLEAVFHKAFLFPKIEQRSEAIKIIRKLLGDPRRVSDLIENAVNSKSLSLWRMLIVCLAESSNPQYDISIEAVRACSSMLQGMLEFCNNDKLLKSETKEELKKMFTSLGDIQNTGFLSLSRETSTIRRSCDEPLKSELMTPSDVASRRTMVDEENTDEISDTLNRLSQKFGTCAQPITRRSTRDSMDSIDHASETATANRFVEGLLEGISKWSQLKSTISVDEAILEFATQFHNDFSATHHDLFKRKARVQQEFLNTDALYLTAYAALSVAYRGADVITWDQFNVSILHAGCVVYASETWLEQVYDAVQSKHVGNHLPKQSSLTDVIKDYDGMNKEILSDVVRLKRIQEGPKKERPYEARLAARWLICSAWDNIVCILNTFLGVKDRRKARQKVLDGIEHSIQGMQKLATVAMELELGDRCGWIFENLVESSCAVEDLRAIASAEEAKRLSVVSRTDLLSIQLVLDNAYVAIHSPICWKHVIRCTEYVWELEKFIYGALCYDKPSTTSFFFKKKDTEKEASRTNPDEGIPVADRTVESALGDRALDRDNVNKALCVLIAKTDRIYSTMGRELSLRSLRDLIQALCSASENRILYSSQPNSPSLTLSTSLIGRITECLSSLPSRPIVHQMLIWPIASQHLLQVACGSELESRCAVSSLQELSKALLSSETAGSCFNQMIIYPIQAIICSDSCSTETRSQLVECLSEFVHLRSDKIGSGWKPLFGALRAVRTADGAEEGLHWTVLDVIGTYLGINKCSVLSWSLPDCLPCIVHFLQSTGVAPEDGTTTVDDQLGAAALKLIKPIYSVIRNLYITPHIPNHNLLHRMELRSISSEEVESTIECIADTVDLLPPLSASLDPDFYLLRPDDPSPLDMDKTLDVPLGPVPWENKEPHQLAAVELLLELVEQLSGVLVTAPAAVQSTLLSALQDLITEIRKTEIGNAPAAFCVSSLLLPHIQKWMRRSATSTDQNRHRNLKHAIGICAQIAVDFVQADPGGAWEIRLLSDVLRLATECAALPSDASRVGAACLRHFETVFGLFEFAHWTIFVKALWDTCSVTLHPLRLFLSFFLRDSNDDNGDLGEVLIEGKGVLPLRDRMLAEQVFHVDAQREHPTEEEVCEAETQCEEVTLIFVKEEKKYRLPVTHLISSLLAHQVVLQLIASLVAPDRKEVPDVLKGVLSSSSTSGFLEKFPCHIRTSLYHCLDASFQVARDLDSRNGARTLLQRTLKLKDANLFKQMVCAGCVKLFSLYHLSEKRFRSGNGELLEHLSKLHQNIVNELERVEKKTVFERLRTEARDVREEKFEFMLVDSEEGYGERVYRLVSEEQIKDTINEYKKQRPSGMPAKRVSSSRQNPFVTVVSKERISADGNEIPSLATLRLVSLREVCTLPVRMCLDSDVFPVLFPIFKQSVSRLIEASPDLTVRRLAVRVIEQLSESSNQDKEDS